MSAPAASAAPADPTADRPDAGCGPAPAAHAIGAPAAARLAAVLKALADPLRLRMLSYVATSAAGEACVCDIARVADVTAPTVSHHLKVLKDVGVLTSQRRGTWVWYRVAPDLRGAVTTLLESFAPAALDAGRRGAPLTGLADVDATLDRAAADLASRFGDLPGDLVLRTVRESYAALVRGAGTAAHLVPTAQRFAAQRLADVRRAAVRASAGAVTGPAGGAVRPPGPPQVLFVCTANAGRSQLAAALLRHHAGDAVVVRSAGSAPAADVHAAVRPLLAELGADQDAYCKPLTDDAVRAADVVVSMGCGDACPVLPGRRYEEWVVGDPALASPEGVAAVRDDLDARVRALLADLLADPPADPVADATPCTDRPEEHP